MGSHQFPYRGSRSRVADHSERFGRAAGDERQRIGNCGAQRLNGRRIADQPEREGGHLPHLWIRVALKQPDERRNASGNPTLPTASAARRRMRASPSPNSRTRSGGGGGGGRRHCGFPGEPAAATIGTWRVAENPLIFQPQNPPNLRFEWNDNRRRRRRNRLATHGQHEIPEGTKCAASKPMITGAEALSRQPRYSARVRRASAKRQADLPRRSDRDAARRRCGTLGRTLDFRYIAIDGPIGAGKTTLAERLATRLDASLVREDEENPFLADFYADRPGAALQTQLFYLLNRHRQLVDRRQADLFSQVAICDYIFEKDRIYAYLNLDDNELFIYQRLFDLLAQDVPTPDLVIYLQTPSDVLLKRLHAREPTPSVLRSCPTRTTCAS